MLDGLTDALGYVGSSLDKLGPRPMRGLLAGRPREAMSFVPFSDEMGLTDPKDIASGRDVTDNFGWTRKGADDPGSHALGLLADVLIDPTTFAAGAGLARKGVMGLSSAMMPSKVNPVHHLANLLGDADAASRLRPLTGTAERMQWGQKYRRGAIGLKFDPLDVPPEGMLRTDPEWVNNKTWYQGSGTPGITPDQLDPMKTSADNLFGRGIYTTANEQIGRSYMSKGVDDVMGRFYGHMNSDRLAEQIMERAESGEFDDFFRKHADAVRRRGQLPRHSAPIEDWTPGGKAQEIIDLAKLHPDASGLRAFQRPDPAIEQAYREAFGLVAPDYPLPKPVLYQAQPEFLKALDLDATLPHDEYKDLYDALTEGFLFYPRKDPHNFSGFDLFRDRPPFAGLEPHLTTSAGDLVQRSVPTKKLIGKGLRLRDQFEEAEDPLLYALRMAGYDALTHTGGTRAGRGGAIHQVLIGLDPNDTLRLGRKTPYKVWEPFHG